MLHIFKRNQIFNKYIFFKTQAPDGTPVAADGSPADPSDSDATGPGGVTGANDIGGGKPSVGTSPDGTPVAADGTPATLGTPGWNCDSMFEQIIKQCPQC